VRCPLFDEMLSNLWDYHYVYSYGSIRTLKNTHILLLMNYFVFYILLFYLSEIGIAYLLSSQLAFDSTSFYKGGEGGEGTVAA